MLGSDELDGAKLARIHRMFERLLAEMRALELDAASIERLQELTQQALVTIGSAVPDELLLELHRVVGGPSTLPPTADELRVIEAQLLGWLHGIVRGERLEDLEADVRAARASLAATAVHVTGYV